MKRLTFAFIVLTFAIPQAQAQEPGATPPSLRRSSITVTGTITPTAEMWLYEQEKMRREDPYYYRLNVAQTKAAQRRARIAARKWYGISGTRPAALGNSWYHNSVNTWGQNVRGRRGLWTNVRAY